MGQMKSLFKNTPILISFMILLLPSVILAIIITISFAPELSDIAGRIKYSYNPIDEHGNSIYNSKELIELLSTKEKINYYLFEFLSIVMWIMPVFVTITVIPYFFYKIKIKKPLQLMLESAEKISNEDLDFVIEYDSKDEMGKLSAAFEKMRSSLEENNKETWRMLEERQKLNAIFAHDLRTPLTVLHGYSDFLMKYVPEEKISKEKLVQTIETMNHHILRIENYVQHMNTVQRFEDVVLKYERILFHSLSEKLQESIRMMNPKQKVDYRLIGNDQSIEVDEHMIHQVFDNILSNAIEYAKNKISIEYKFEKDVYSFKISDDGIGFLKEDLPYVTQPFYRSDKDFNKQHFGLGLHTSKKICEKHGGKLILKNNGKGGASIIASFKIKKVDKK